MAESLTINGKEYIPSTALAVRFNYTPDYIAKLARDEKILATQVGRQWFIEPASLETFLKQVEIQKSIRKEELRRERQLEHLTHQSQKEVVAKAASFSPEAFAQAVVIVLCGALVGGLGWVAASEGVGASQLASGARANVVAVIENVFRVEVETDPARYVASSVESGAKRVAGVPPQENVVFAQLPVFPERSSSSSEEVLASTSAVSVAQEAELALPEFSDEVQIVKDSNGDTYVVPVFKDGADEDGRFLLMSVTESEN